jgi:hypothetical protein
VYVEQRVYMLQKFVYYYKLPNNNMVVVDYFSLSEGAK